MPAVEMPWRKLVESIKRGNCILILGPQVSFDPANSDHLPLATALARRLADHAVLGRHDRATRGRRLPEPHAPPQHAACDAGDGALPAHEPPGGDDPNDP